MQLGYGPLKVLTPPYFGLYHTTLTHSGAYREGMGCQGTTLDTAQF